MSGSFGRNVDIEVERSWVAGAFARFGAQGHLCDKSVALPSENIESALPDSLLIGLARAITGGCAKILAALEVPSLQLLLCISTSQLGSFLHTQRMTDGQLGVVGGQRRTPLTISLASVSPP